LFDLSHKNILITGALGTLGRAYVDAITSCGGNVFALDLPSEHPFATQNSVRYWQCDLSVEANVSRVFDEISKVTNCLDAIVSNAAITGEFIINRGGNPFAELSEYALEDWNNVLSVNLTAPFLLAKYGETLLGAGTKPVFINVSSVYGFVSPDFTMYDDQPFGSMMAYSASKAGVHGITLWLSGYWKKLGIRVNTIVPGGVYNGHSGSFSNRYASKTIAGKMADPTDMVGPLIFLLSNDASYVSGHSLVVDGGLTSSA
jgi:3-oxoacyl-[acyl-carrier protein] reductase